MDDKAMDLFNTISKIVGAKNSLVTLVDAEGFTPFLRLIQTFAKNGKDVLTNTFSTLRDAKLAHKQREWDEKHNTQTTTAPVSLQAAKTVAGSSLFRQKVAALPATTGVFGKAPRKAVKSSMFGGGGLFGATPALDANDPTDIRPVSLTTE